MARGVSNTLPTQITSVPRVHYFDTSDPAITANPLLTPLMVVREIVKKLNPPLFPEGASAMRVELYVSGVFATAELRCSSAERRAL